MLALRIAVSIACVSACATARCDEPKEDPVVLGDFVLAECERLDCFYTAERFQYDGQKPSPFEIDQPRPFGLKISNVGFAYARLYNPQDEDAAGMTPAEARRSIFASADVNVRFQAAAVLSREATTDRGPLLKNLKRLAKAPRRDVFSECNVAVVMAGRLRMTEAVPVLLPLADASLDLESFPGGIFESMYFPAAESLVQIGGREVVDGILAALEGTRSQEQVLIYAWILQESLGRRPATAVVTDAAERAEAGTDLAENTDLARRLLVREELYLRSVTPATLGAEVDRILKKQPE